MNYIMNVHYSISYEHLRIWLGWKSICKDEQHPRSLEIMARRGKHLQGI